MSLFYRLLHRLYTELLYIFDTFCQFRVHVENFDVIDSLMLPTFIVFVT